MERLNWLSLPEVLGINSSKKQNDTRSTELQSESITVTYILSHVVVKW